MARPDNRSPVRRPPAAAARQRELVLRALTRPLTVAAGALLALLAVVLGATWLLVIALVVAVTLVTLTLLEEDPERPTPEIRRQLDAARHEQALIGATITGAVLTFADVRDEVAQLVRALEGAAGRAQRLERHLAGHDRDDLRQRRHAFDREGDTATADALGRQLAELDRLAAMLRDTHAEMEQVNAALRTVHSRLVGVAVTRQAADEAELAGDVRELRERVDTLTTGLPE